MQLHISCNTRVVFNSVLNDDDGRLRWMVLLFDGSCSGLTRFFHHSNFCVSVRSFSIKSDDTWQSLTYLTQLINKCVWSCVLLLPSGLRKCHSLFFPASVSISSSSNFLSLCVNTGRCHFEIVTYKVYIKPLRRKINKLPNTNNNNSKNI